MSDPFASNSQAPVPSDPAAPTPPPYPTTPAPVPTTAIPPAPAVRPVKKSNRGSSLLLGLAGIIAVAGIAFAAGRLTAPAAAAAGGNDGNGGGRFGGFPNGSFPPGGFRGGQGGPGAFIGGGVGSIDLRGQVTAVSTTSITIKLGNGTEVTVPLDSQTTYHQATSATASNVSVGSTVDVQPGQTGFTPGASPNPAASGAPGFGGVSFGPATDVTVVNGGSPAP